VLSDAARLPPVVALSAANLHHSQAFKPLLMALPAIRSHVPTDQLDRTTSPATVDVRNADSEAIFSTRTGHASGIRPHDRRRPLTRPPWPINQGLGERGG
jgi:hypothetical protein